ncbi:hypothetical protein GCM10027514_30700 [Azotobacter armeniacus]
MIEPPRVLDGLVVGQMLEHIGAHQIAQGIGLPATTAENGLLTPGAGIAGCLGAHPAGLAWLVAQQAIEEQAGRGRHSLLGKQGAHTRLDFAQR